MRTLKAATASIRSTLHARRDVASQRRQLKRELARFTSPAERAEIEAIIDRHPRSETREIRDILARQSMQRAVANRSMFF